MKKLLLTLIAVFSIGIYSSFAQATTDFKIGVHAGIPVGDMADFSDFNLGADVSYLFGVAGMLEVGPLVGYSRYFVEDIDLGEFGSLEMDDASFLPVAASGRVDLGPVFAGLDLGYAVGLNDGNDGGFYYRPKVGVGFFGLNLIGSYSGISMDGGDVSSVNLGVEFSF